MDSCNTFAHIQHNCSNTGKVTLKDIKLISSLALTHWVPVMNICISKLTIIESDNDLSLGQCQAIIWTNAGILLIQIMGAHFGEILSKLHTVSFKKMHLKLLSGKWHPFLSWLQCVKTQQNATNNPLYTWFLRCSILYFNSSPTGQNGSHFTDDIFRCIFVSFVFKLKFQWSLSLRVQLTITQHWLR